MRLIKPSYEIIEQGPGLQGIYDIIEHCGKISYKSEPKGGEVAQRFVEARAKEKHGAVLEFGTVYLKMNSYDSRYRQCIGLTPEEGYEKKAVEFYKNNKYSKFKKMWGLYYITTNYRVLVENDRLDDLKYLCEPTEYHEKRYAVKFTTDIGVGREFLRHRVMSMVQESTRYVNYMKEKFGEQCTFVIPPWIDLPECEDLAFWDGDWVDMDKNKIVRYGPAELQIDPIHIWLESLNFASDSYQMLVQNGWQPQQARGVLPLSTKTEFILCGFEDAWVHFFRLRSDIAATGKAHPMSIQLANPLRDEFVERGYLTEENLKHDSFEPFDICISDVNLKD